MELRDKTVIVTGASSGIGRATALEMARRGAHLVLAARRLEALESTAAECRSLGVRATVVQADVTRAEDCARIIEAASEAADVLVNSAGFAVFDAVTDAAPATVRAMMETNFFGMFYCTQAVLPQMLARRSGTIVNIASITGLMGFARMSAYCASKFATVGFSEAVRDEVLPFGVRVALVCPGTTETEFFARADRKQMPGASRLVPGLTAERVARAVCDAAEDGRYRRILPGAAAIYMRMKELLPRFAHLLMRRVSALLERS